MQTSDRPTAIRLAVLAVKILACVAAGLILLLFALTMYVGSQVGDIWSPGRTSGKVGDAELRLDYDRIPLVTETQIAALRRQMPAKEAYRALGGRPKVFVPYNKIHGHWVKGHRVRTGISYDYPIAGTGHLYHGITVADELEITISERSKAVTKITRIPWREVGKQAESG